MALQILINGIVLSSIYAIVAVGLTLVFGILQIFNFSHGELLMWGGFVTWFIFSRLDVPFIPAVLIAIASIAAFGILIERVLFKPVRTRPFGGLLLSLGLMYILQSIALLVFGPRDKGTPLAFSGQISVGGYPIFVERLAIAAVVIAVIVALWLFLERTKHGRAIRACVQDSEAASLQGISRNKMSTMVMGIAGGLAGLAGSLVFQFQVLGPFSGTLLILKSFVVVIAGGAGSVAGTLLAAAIFGFMDTAISSAADPRFVVLADVMLMIIILLIRPKGLLGRGEA